MTVDSPIEITGEYTDAKIMTQDVDQQTQDLIQKFCNHPGYQNPIRVMPDAHAEPNSQNVIGFTMQMNDKICPNTVGFDIGCGLSAMNYGSIDLPAPEEVDELIRSAVPLGVNTFSRGPYNVVKNFPLYFFNMDLTMLLQGVVENPESWQINSGQLEDYFKDLCDRVDTDAGDVIDGVGTLGGGNHFIEVCEDDDDNIWIVVHSGSRNLGKMVGKHHQEIAEKSVMKEHFYENMEKSRRKYLDKMFSYEAFGMGNMSGERIENWFQGQVGGTYYDKDSIREDFEGEKIDETMTWYKDFAREVISQSDSMAYLQGVQAGMYLRDMLFSKVLATENRLVMLQRISDALELEHVDVINNAHNFVDPRNKMIRKGATPAHQNEKAIIPFNMGVGSVIVEGKGNPAFNLSAPHGAGRPRSRTESRNMITDEQHYEDIEGVYTSSPADEIKDESPRAYKKPGPIEQNMEPTVDVKRRLYPLISVKADYRDIPWKTREE